MLPCLQLLITLRGRPEMYEQLGAAVKMLEGLLIEHIFLPFRTHFLNQQEHDNDQSNSSIINLGDYFISAFTTYHFPRPKVENQPDKSMYDVKREAAKIKMHLMISMMSLSFSLALHSRPRHTSSQTNSWLEELFMQITKCAPAALHSVSPNHVRKESSRLLEWMLHESIEGELTLSVSTLGSILERASGLFSDEDSCINWRIINLCLLVDASVFTMPLPSASQEGNNGHSAPNRYLSSLLANLTRKDMVLSPEENWNWNYELYFSEITGPLSDAFSNARDLATFLGHWEEQLDLIQRQRDENDTEKNYAHSVWEDDKLSEHVGRLIEHSLTAGQINQILKSAADNLSSPSVDAVNNDIRLASLVIINCIVFGVTQEETFYKLSDTWQLIYSSVERLLLLESSNQASMHRWRLWRILATVTDRQISLGDFSVIQSHVHTAICGALEFIRQAPKWRKSDRSLDLSETLHAFRFLLSFIDTDQYHFNDLRFSPRQKISSAIEKLLEIMDPFCDRVRRDFFETVKADKRILKLKSSNAPIQDIDELYIQCMSYLLSKPEGLR